MENIKLIIQVKGGMVQHISSNNDNIDIILIDWDNIEQGDQFPDETDLINIYYKFDDLKKYLQEIIGL